MRQELWLVGAAILLFFGASRLPQLGSSFGAAIRNFKKGFSGEEESSSNNVSKPETQEDKSAPRPS